jgi:hypothetical protein
MILHKIIYLKPSTEVTTDGWSDCSSCSFVFFVTSMLRAAVKLPLSDVRSQRVPSSPPPPKPAPAQERGRCRRPSNERRRADASVPPHAGLGVSAGGKPGARLLSGTRTQWRSPEAVIASAQTRERRHLLRDGRGERPLTLRAHRARETRRAACAPTRLLRSHPSALRRSSHSATTQSAACAPPPRCRCGAPAYRGRQSSSGTIE